MKKWLSAFFILLLLITGIFTSIYTKAKAPLKKGEAYAYAMAKKEANIISPEKFYLYHGSETYYVVIGQTKNEKRKVIWIPENKQSNILIRDYSQGIKEEEALEKVLNEKKRKKILGIRLGMEKEIPLWEISYLDMDDTLNYYYVHFDSGDWWRKIENL